MSFIADLLNPPQPNMNAQAQYKFDNSVNDMLQALAYEMNPSVISNADFSAGGATITQANGDGAVFFTGWQVQGASLATYALTPTNYPSASNIKTKSLTYSHVAISGYTANSGLFLYQRQVNTVRQFQSNNLTFGLIINNNQNKTIQLTSQIFNYYDTTSSLNQSSIIFLKPGLNRISNTIKTNNLPASVGTSPYVDFRLEFLDLGDGTADINIYQCKCEFGTASTLLNQS